MSFVDCVSLFMIMIMLAALPSTSVALVVTRSVTNGTSNGIAVAAGIVVGDLIFIMLAVTGLSVIAQTMSWLFMGIKYLGAGYLIFLGIRLILSAAHSSISVNNTHHKAGLLTSFMAGLFLTLGDIKAIFFYVSLLPTFIDLSVLSTVDLLIIIFITIVAVGGIKIVYAFTAVKISSMTDNVQLQSIAKKMAGTFLVGAGSYLIFKT